MAIRARIRLLTLGTLLVPLTALDAQDLSLELACSVPAPPHRYVGLTLDARLWEFDPRLADAPATEVDRHQIHGIDLVARAIRKIPVSLSTKRKSDRRYYVTVFIHPNPLSSERLYFIDGFKAVFDGVDSEETAITLTRTSKPIPPANSDRDGDGFDDEAEIEAGTDPGDASSRFEIVSITVEGDRVTITWVSAVGRRYSVLSGSGLEALEPIAESVTSAGTGTTSFTTARRAGETYFAVAIE